MKKSKYSKGQIISLCLSLAIVVLSFFPWFTDFNNGKGIFIWNMLLGSPSVSGIIPIQVLGGLFLILPTLYSIYIIQLLRGRDTFRYESVIIYLSMISLFLSFFVIMLTGIGDIISFTCYPVINYVLIIIEFLITRMVDSWIEENKKLKEAKTKERSTKEIQKKDTQAMVPPIIKHNSKELYRVMFKNFMHNWRNYMLFFSSTVISVTLVYATLAIKGMMGNIHSAERIYMGEGLFGILKTTIQIIGALTIMLMLFSLKYYVKSRIKDYSMFIILGIQKKTLHLLIGAEYVCSLVFSLLMGFIFGNVLAFIFQKILGHYFVEIGGLHFPVALTSGMTLLICTIIFLFAAVVNYEIFIESDMSHTMNVAVIKDKLPAKICKPLCVVGIICITIAIVFYHKRKMAEGVGFIYIFFMGVFLLLKYGGSLALAWLRRRRRYYYRNIMPLNNFYYRFRNNANNMFVLFALHFLALFYFASQIITTAPNTSLEKLYPYDYVCKVSDTGKAQVDELAKKYGVEIISVPMFQLSVPGGSEEYTGGMTTAFQGQHMGISASTYEKLTGEKLSLKGKEIHIVFQEDIADKTHPLDWDGMREKPKIRIAPAMEYAWYERDTYFHADYPVISEERQSLIGYLAGGIQEDLVVFSDRYFKEAMQQATGEKNLILMKMEPDTSSDIKDKIETRLAKIQTEYEKTYSEYPYVSDYHIKAVYNKELMLKDAKAEHVLKFIVNLFIMITLMASGLFIIYIKMASEVPYLRTKYQFLTCMGMRKKQRRKNLRQEYYAFVILPLVIAILCSIGFTRILFYLRFFTKKEMQFYGSYGGWFIVTYLAIYLIGIIAIQHHVVRKVEER
ncbi:MAG: hypothetical protein RR717_04115 [Lachnospiraceae bacterium]